MPAHPRRILLPLLLLPSSSPNPHSLNPQPRPPPPTPTTKPRPFISMQDILTHVPAELRPQNKPDWYKFTEGKYKDWWEQQLLGMTFEQTLPFYHHVDRSIIAYPGQEWTLRGGFDTQTFTSFSADHKWSLAYADTTMDEPAAKKWNALRPGTRFKVTGTISAVNIQLLNSSQPTAFPAYSLRLTLSHLQLTPIK